MNISRISFLLNFIVAGLVLWMSFNIYETWRADKQERNIFSMQNEENASPQDTSSVKSKRFSEYQAVVGQDIFHTSRASENKPLEQAKDIEITPLNIKLKGVVLREGEASFAVIYDDNSKGEDLYYLNDYVQGARVVQVLPDRVILSRGGKQEALMLEVESAPESKRGDVIKARRPIPRRVTPGR